MDLQLTAKHGKSELPPPPPLPPKVRPKGRPEEACDRPPASWFAPHRLAGRLQQVFGVLSPMLIRERHAAFKMFLTGLATEVRV